MSQKPTNTKGFVIETAEEFADALTKIANLAVEDDDFREKALKDPYWAVSKATDGGTLVDGVTLKLFNCNTKRATSDSSGPWPGVYPGGPSLQPLSFEAHLPSGHPSLPDKCFAKLDPDPVCSCPPFTMC